MITNIPDVCLCIWTHDIMHSSLRIIIYLCEQCNDMITTTISKTQPPIMTNSQRCHLLFLLDTSPEMNKVMKNSLFIKVVLRILMMQTNHIHWTLFLCLPLAFFLVWNLTACLTCCWLVIIQIKIIIGELTEI